MPVRIHSQSESGSVIIVFPVPLRYRTFSLPRVAEERVVVPSHVDQADVSVEYSSVPSQCCVVYCRVKLLGELNVRYGLKISFFFNQYSGLL